MPWLILKLFLIRPVQVNILFSVKHNIVILLWTMKMYVTFATHLLYTHRTQMFKLLSLAFMSWSAIIMSPLTLSLFMQWAHLHKYLPPGICKGLSVETPIKRHYFPIPPCVFGKLKSRTFLLHRALILSVPQTVGHGNGLQALFWLVGIMSGNDSANTFKIILFLCTVGNFIVAWIGEWKWVLPSFHIYTLLLFIWNICYTKVLADHTEHLYILF